MKTSRAIPGGRCSLYRRTRSTAFLLKVICVIVAAGVMDSAATDVKVRSGENRFRWNEVNSTLSTARHQDDFAAVALRYREMIMDGVLNGPLFYNYGIALLKAEAYEEATVAFLRAERQLGSNAEIRRNLVIAAAGGGDERPSLPWYRTLFFWHYGLAGSVRTTIAASAFTLVWFALAIRALRFKGLSRQLLPPAIIVLLLFGASVCATLYSENRDQNRLLAHDISKAEVSDP